MVRSETDNDKETVPPKPIRKAWTMGSIPATDKDFLEWCGHQTTKKRATLSMTKLYVQQLNLEGIMLHERQQKEKKEQLHLADTAEAISSSEPTETLTTSITNDTSMNTPTPNPQNILSTDSQNISNPDPQNNPAPLNLEPPPQISPSLPASTLLPPADPKTDQEQGEQGTAGTLNVNNLTMDQALELFESLQTRRTRETHQSSTVEAHHVEVAPERSEPLSFLTLQTVERIVGSTNFNVPQCYHNTSTLSCLIALA
jgi:hypothetical protein